MVLFSSFILSSSFFIITKIKRILNILAMLRCGNHQCDSVVSFWTPGAFWGNIYGNLSFILTHCIFVNFISTISIKDLNISIIDSSPDNILATIGNWTLPQNFLSISYNLTFISKFAHPVILWIELLLIYQKPAKQIYILSKI